jgi:transcriptional regulator with XRE-family HTH domain
MTQTSLAERLRVLRARRGLSVSQASQEIGIEWHTLRDLELGRRKPYYPTLHKIAQGYDVPVEQLLSEEGNIVLEASDASHEGATSPLEQAPISSEPAKSEAAEEEIENRRLELRNFGDLIENVHALLNDLADTYKAARDIGKLETLVGIAVFTQMGVSQRTKEEVGPVIDRETARIYLAGSLLEALADDLIEYHRALLEPAIEAAASAEEAEKLRSTFRLIEGQRAAS